jgi:hypothetical protein
MRWLRQRAGPGDKQAEFLAYAADGDFLAKICDRFDVAVSAILYAVHVRHLKLPESANPLRAFQPVDNELPVIVETGFVFSLILGVVLEKKVQRPLVIGVRGQHKLRVAVGKNLGKPHFIPFFGRPGLRTRTAARDAGSMPHARPKRVALSLPARISD